MKEIFTKDEIRLLHPYVSESTINRALIKLRDEISQKIDEYYKRINSN